MKANATEAVVALPRAEYALPRAMRGRAWHCAAMLALAACLLLAAGSATPAMAKPAKPVRIGVLTNSWGPTPGSVGLRDGLVELGHKENEHFTIGVRFVRGDLSTLPAAARELVEIGVDIIFAVGINAARAAQRATSKIPILFTGVDDPVEMGLVQSYARPGGNITGVSDANAALAPKRLEVFKLMIPRLRKVLYVYDGSDPGSAKQEKAYRGAARRLGVELVARAVRTEAEAQAALEGLSKSDVSGILVPVDIVLNIPGLVVRAAARESIPAMYPAAFWMDQGGLASYAPGFYSSGRQAARLVDKIMRGVKPADIPVEVNNDIEFAVNLKVAKALGLKISPQVLYQATKIIR